LLSEDHSALNGAFKVPSLRNVANTAPYMHDGRFKTLKEVLEHYRSPKHPTPATEIRPFFDMSADGEDAIIAFLASLSGPIDAPAAFLKRPLTPVASH
jgi:cytochrome c peroxidase